MKRAPGSSPNTASTCQNGVSQGNGPDKGSFDDFQWLARRCIRDSPACLDEAIRKIVRPRRQGADAVIKLVE